MPLVLIMSQLNSLHVTPSFVFKIPFNTFPLLPISSKWPFSFRLFHQIPAWVSCLVCFLPHNLPISLELITLILMKINCKNFSGRGSEVCHSWKCKVFPCKHHKFIWWKVSTDPVILDLGTRWSCVVNFILLPLYLWERTLVPFDY